MGNIEKQIQKIEKELKKTNKREYIRIKAIILQLKANSAISISEKLDLGKSTVFV